MRNLLALFLVLFPVLFPVAASAQHGSIRFDLAVRFDFDLLPEGREALRDQIPARSFASMVLLFDGSESLMAPALSSGVPADRRGAPAVKDLDAEKPETIGFEANARLKGLVERLKMGSTSRSDHEKLLQIYVNHEDGTVAEAVEFMGRDFLIRGEQVTYPWRLTGEQSEFLGFVVQRATALQDSTTIEAWFTTEIPISAGPGPYSGLPGMILVVSVDNEQLVYSATEVNLDALEAGVIRPPEDGNEVSRDEYEEIVAEKLDEVRTLGAPRWARDRVRRGNGR